MLDGPLECQQPVMLEVKTHREWRMGLEKVLLASRETGDYMPVWEQLVNTKLFVSVFTNETGPEISNFRFEIRESQQDENLYIVVSDNLDDLARSGCSTAIRENAYKLLNMIRPELGMIIAISGGEHFYIPPGLVDWIRKSTQVVDAQDGNDVTSLSPVGAAKVLSHSSGKKNKS